MHGDLKCANLLVDTEGRVKLSDFGASKKLSQIELSMNSSDRLDSNGQRTNTLANKDANESIHGSPYWMAPEVVKH